MKILFVLEHYAPYLGGAEKLFRQVTQLLVAQGHQVRVVTTQFRPELPQQECLDGVEVHRIKCRNRFLFTFLSLPAVWRAASWADIIHTTTYNAALPAWLAGRLRRKATLITYHEHWGKLWFQLPFLKWWERYLFFGFEKLISRLPFSQYIAVSEATKQALIQADIPESKVVRIYNGLNYGRFKQVNNHPPIAEFRLSFVGRLGVSKGLDLLIPAWGNFAKANTDKSTVLQLVTPTYPKPLFDTVNKMIQAYCPPNSVQLLHELSREELDSVLQKSHAIVIPSYNEGFCFVAAEAVAMALPIISSGRGALAEVVGGQYIELGELSVDCLIKAFEQAQSGEWDYRPPRYFPLREAGAAYSQLYARMKDVYDY